MHSNRILSKEMKKEQHFMSVALLLHFSKSLLINVI